MNIRLRYWTHYGYLVLLLLITATTSILTLRSLGSAIDVIFRANYMSTLAGQQMILALERADSALLHAASLQSDERQLIVQLETSKSEFMSELSKARANITLRGEAEAIQRIRQAYSEYQAAVDTALPALRELEFWNHYATGIDPRFRQLKIDINELVTINQRAMQEADQRARSMARKRTFIMSAICALGLLSLFFMSRSFDNWVIVPLNRLREAVKAMAQGEPLRRPPVISQPEIGDLSVSIGRLADRYAERVSAMAARLEASGRTVRAMVDLQPGATALVGPSGAILASNEAFHTFLEEQDVEAALEEIRADEEGWSAIELPGGQGMLYQRRVQER